MQGGASTKAGKKGDRLMKPNTGEGHVCTHEHDLAAKF